MKFDSLTRYLICLCTVDFNNVLRAAFTNEDPRSKKKTVKLSGFFTLLGSAFLPADNKMLVKLTPGVDFNNVLQAVFTNEDPKSTKNTVKPSVFFCAFGICKDPKSTKKTVKPSVFFTLLGSAFVPTLLVRCW
jgi:hypothetical protein